MIKSKHTFRYVTFSENRAVYEIMSKKCGMARDHNWQHNMANARCMLDKQGYTRPGTHPPTNKHVILFHGNNSFANAPQCYVIRTLPVFKPFTLFPVKLLFSRKTTNGIPPIMLLPAPSCRQPVWNTWHWYCVSPINFADSCHLSLSPPPIDSIVRERVVSPLETAVLRDTELLHTEKKNRRV